MERALDIDLVNNALGRHPLLTQNSEDPYRRVQWLDPASAPTWPDTADDWRSALPTADELQDLIAQTEVRLFLGQEEFPDELLRSAWYLHGVASASTAAQLYTVGRQRNAFALSAHIFDLATVSVDTPRPDRLKMAFAAQVGYHRSEKEPNAIAIERRVRSSSESFSVNRFDIETLAVEAGVSLLGLDTAAARRNLTGWREQLADLVEAVAVDDITRTIFGPAFCVVESVHLLLQFLTLGNAEDLDQAASLLDAAVSVPEGAGDHDARWVASHLRFLADEISAGSVWTMIPPDVPSSAKQAFTLTAPTVLSLWQPQRLLLNSEDSEGAAPEAQALNALDPTVRRIVLSVPTSAGKTLLSQLLTVSFLARSSLGVCYVVPQRSLVREIRRDLSARLLLLGKNLGREVPDFGLDFDDLLRTFLADADLEQSSKLTGAGDVSVMTPEGLDQALRQSPDDVLDRYGMFVFDEVHLIKERSRGFKLESVLSFLHSRTANTDHKLVLLSAALGNAGQLATWVSGGSPAKLLQSDWRGPRRLHAIYNSSIDWNDPTYGSVKASGKKSHLTRTLAYDTYGRLRLRLARERSQSVITTQPVGKTVFRATESLDREASPEASRGTAGYVMLAEIVRHVGQAGPVLVFRTTRRDSVQMAIAVGAQLGVNPACADLAQVAAEKLSERHPLPGLLAKGVAFHHAGLPIDIQEAIEDALREGLLNYIVATTTLAEGVNLPVRTVVLATNEYEGQPPELVLSGSRLVNAVGRAGRATKESEGWVIIARHAPPAPEDFELFEPDDEDLAVSSVLVEDSALEALAEFESAVRAGEDGVMAATGELADFVKFVWFTMAAQEEIDRSVLTSTPLTAFTTTLAYRQLPIDVRERYEDVIARVHNRYANTDPDARIRWSKTGTLLSSSRSLDRLAQGVVDTWSYSDLTEDSSPEVLIDFLDDLGCLDGMLWLGECPASRLEFKDKPGKNGEFFQVAPGGLLKEWISGASLFGIAERLFSRIVSDSTRLEKAVDSVTDFCEHYFAWMLSALASLVNSRIDDDSARFPTSLAAFVRYGVRSSCAVEILTAGIHSRDLANSIASSAADEQVEDQDVLSWLSSMEIEDWKSRFAVTNIDIRELLEYCRNREDSLLRDLLSHGVAKVDLSDSVAAEFRSNLRLESGQARGLATLRLYAGPDDAPELIGRIPVDRQLEVDVILSTGLDIGLEFSHGALELIATAIRDRD